jgi:hypothetical protein
METYDWAWIQRQVAHTAEIWHESAGRPEGRPRCYSPEEQRQGEEAYDEALLSVEQTLRSAPVGKREQTVAQDRIVAAFAQFSARALGLDEEANTLLTQKFLPIGTSLAQWARRFDSSLSMPEIIQAARNAWTACGLQPLVGAPLALTPSILGYSLLYPYSDNFLDDEGVSADAKSSFGHRFQRRLSGEKLLPKDDRECSMWALIALIEAEYPRALYPNVFECLLAIHRAQQQSVGQVHNGDSFCEAECLRVSCGKGGSSVLADACLGYGSLTGKQSQFAFEWGVLLQLGDDLQDIHEDMRRGSMTLFSRAAASGRPLDGLTVQLMNFSERVGKRMEELPDGTAGFKELLKMSWRSLIIAAVADSHQFFSDGFLHAVEPYSPFRFEFLRARKKRIASRRGVYARLFDALLDSGQDCGDGLPSPDEWAKRPSAPHLPPPVASNRQTPRLSDQKLPIGPATLYANSKVF